ncbi:MAG: tryptophan-rich sensory protein [Brachybacterium sp.]|nr:tryptophan-rich sensory protein [Brachybacterium sp.]
MTAAAVIWVFGTLFGFGLIGGEGVEEQGEGLFSDAATLIAPHGPAFSIWSVIYGGIALYVIWQWLPWSRDSGWARVSRVPAAVAIALNGVWLLVTFQGWITASVVVILAIALSLGVLWDRVARLPAEGPVPAVLLGGTFGLYLGWVCVAVCANVAVWIVSWGWEIPIGMGAVITLVVLAVVVALVAGIGWVQTHVSWTLAFHLAVAWGLAWVAAGRFVGELQSNLAAWGAVVATLAVAGLCIGQLRRIAASSSGGGRSARGESHRGGVGEVTRV